MPYILLLYEVLIPSVRLCAYEQLKYLEEQGKVVFKHCEVKNVTQAMCTECDIVIMVRSYTVLEEKLAKEFKKKGKLLLYVLDDDLLNIADNLSSSEYLKIEKVRNRILSIMKQCDILLTPSPIIERNYRDIFKKTVIIEEPCLSYCMKKVKNDSKVKIGFAGSIDREGDIDAIVSDVIRELILKYPNQISVEFMGAKPKIVEELNLVHYDYEDNYKAYKERLEELNWDIGLAPMPDTEFHRSKHYNKFIEYGSASIIGVYSNIEPYTRVIIDRQNGLLCNNSSKDWVDAISWLIENPDERERIRLKINKELADKFNISIVSEFFYNNIPELIKYKVQHKKKLYLKKITIKCELIRVLEFIQRNGIRSPYAGIKKIIRRNKK